MRKDSVLQIAKSLHVPERDIKVLRANTLRWLEDTFRNDKVIAGLCKMEIVKQARSFVETHGGRFFKAAIKDGIIATLSDKHLIYQVSKMMSCQVKYKRQTVEARSRRRGTEVLVGSDTDDTESSSDSHKARHEDNDYEPTITVARSAQSKLHNTRLNAQPGMPIHNSIEADKDGVSGEHLPEPFDEAQANEPFSGALSRSSDDQTLLSPNVDDSVFSHRPRAERAASRDFRVYSTPPPLDRILNWETVTNDTTCQSPEMTSTHTVDVHQNAPPRSPKSSHPRLGTENATANTDSVSAELEFPDVDFNHLLDSGSIRDTGPATITVNDWRSSPLPVLSKRPRCQDTPPGSGRSQPVSKSVTHRGHHTHGQLHRTGEISDGEDMDSDQPECRIYLGGDHFKVINRDRADQALQAVFNVLNDFSRGCQDRSRSRNTSAAQQKLEEQVAKSVCHLVRRLRNSEQVWGEVDVDQTKIEVLDL